MDVFNIRLLSVNGKHHLSPMSGVLFHGFLNREIPNRLSHRLHSSQVPLFHQKFKFYQQTVDWQIISFDHEVSEAIRQIIMTKDRIHLKHKQLTLKLVSATESVTQSLSDWLLGIQALNLQTKDCFVNITTPTSHKVKGEYLGEFNLEVVYKHIIRKMNLLQQTIYIGEDSLKLLMEGTQICKLATKTQTIQLKGIKIPAYTGNVQLRWNGEEGSLPVFNLLWLFAEMSGVGIKTSMGYGNVNLL